MILTISVCTMCLDGFPRSHRCDSQCGGILQVQADGSEVPLEGAKLDAAVKDAAEAQEVQEEADQPVIAQVVKIDPAVELASGDGDVSTTGVFPQLFLCISFHHICSICMPMGRNVNLSAVS